MCSKESRVWSGLGSGLGLALIRLYDYDSSTPNPAPLGDSSGNGGRALASDEESLLRCDSITIA